VSFFYNKLISLDNPADFWHNRSIEDEIESEFEMKAKNSKFDLSELCGWVGMVLIHAATLPTSLGVILGHNDRLPPVSMVLMVWAGLFLFLVRALGRNDRLYIISNAVGFFFNSVLLALIVFK
jgi:hypothetical protein